MAKSTIYKKRSGTSNEGSKYEQLNIANILLNFFETQVDFELSTNDADAGDFDDICWTIKNLTTLTQLKHSANNSRKLSVNQLEASQGDFSILKYYHSYINSKIKADKLILFTNRKFHLANPQILTTEEFKVEIIKTSSLDFINTSNTKDFYQFKLIQSSVRDKSKILSYEDFFSKFFLYVNQINCKELEIKVQEKFCKFLPNCEFNSFIIWIRDWWEQEGKVEKLNSEWIQTYFQILFFSSRIKIIKFTPTNLTEKQMLLKKIIDKFEISIFKETSYEKLQSLWACSDNKLIDIKPIKKLISKFNISRQIENIKQLDDRTKTILLWLLDESPLLVIGCDSLINVPPKKIVFLLKENEEFSTNLCYFQNLSHLTDDNNYKILVEKLSFCRANQEFFLNQMIDSENIIDVVTSDVILELSSCTPNIGGLTEENLDSYQNRLISYNLVNNQFFEQQSQSTLLIIDNVENISIIKQRFFQFSYINYNFENIGDLDFSESTIIYSRDKISEKNFRKIAKNNPKFQKIHKFRSRDESNIEWIMSGSNIDDLRNYVSLDFEPEDNLLQSINDNTVNLLIDNSGMGKTVFLKKISNSLVGFWPLLIDPNDIDSLLLIFKSQNLSQNLENFILEYKHKNLTNIEKQILQICLKSKKIIFLWDGLDEVSLLNYNLVIDIILELSKFDYIQWLTSRSHLRVELETKLNVLSKNLKEFTTLDQDNYIKTRLENFIPPTKIDKIIKKIRSKFMFVEHKNLLGIPLQIFMLTELLRQNSNILENFQDNFLVTNLYKFFIEEKLKICKQKLCLESPRYEEIFEFLEPELMKTHEIKALIAVLPLNIFQKLNLKNPEGNAKIDKVQFAAGLIKEIINGIPRFVHGSFGEYLVAFYFFQNQHQNGILKEFIFEPKFDNVRFFFDLFMGEDCKPHIAVLHQNFNFLQNQELASCKDKGGRSPLHLLSSWGLYHQQLDITKKSNQYFINHLGVFDSQPTELYLQTEDLLLTHYDNFEKDNFFEMTPLAYAEKRNCLSIQIKLILKNQQIQTINDNDFINMLYYSVKFGYNNIIDLFKKIPKTKEEQHQIINCKNMINLDLLFLACLTNNFLMVKFLVQNGINLNHVTNLGLTSLHIAARNGNYLVVEFLVESGAKINILEKNGFTALHIAAQHGHLAVVQYLHKVGAEINFAPKPGYTPLYIAAQNNHIAVVQYLIKFGAEINLATTDGVTPLYIASQKGHYEIVQILVKSGANINFCTAKGFTAFSIAVQNGHLTVVQYLVKNGAKITVATKQGATSLYIAAHQGNLELAQYLVKIGLDINVPSLEKASPLYIAAQMGHLSMVQFLLKVGADINLATIEGFTPLFIASQNGHLAIVEYLVKTGADINFATKEGFTALHSAAQNNQFDVVRSLVSSGAKINLACKKKGTTLYFAVQNKHFEMIQFLVKSGANINFVDQTGITPLLIAATNGDLNVVQYLIKSGADFNLATTENFTPLFVAAENGHLDCVRCLFIAGAGINVVAKNGVTPLVIAARRGHLNVVQYLVKHGADINFATPLGLTSLFIAALEGHFYVVQYLVKSGADIDCVTKVGATPLHIVAQNGFLSLVQFLVKVGAQINCTSRVGVTPLYLAAQNGHFDVVRRLVDAGADVNIANEDGLTPFHIACYCGYLDIVKFLVKFGAVWTKPCKLGYPIQIAYSSGHMEVVQFLRNLS